MSDVHETQTEWQPPVPNPDLKPFDRLIGTWRVTGGAEGTVRYAWLEGGFFLVQHIDLVQHGQTICGIEIIGHLRPFGGEESSEIRSRYYDSMGNTFDYVYELDGDALTIWGGEKGSPAYYRATFGADGNTLTGGWTYPDGGGYETTSTRVADAAVEQEPSA